MGGPPSANVFHAPLLPKALAVGLTGILLAAVPVRASALSVDRVASSTRDASFLSARAGPQTSAAQMAYLVQTLQKFRNFALASVNTVEARHGAERDRLHVAARETDDEGVKLALEQTITGNEQSLKETERMFFQMVNFSNSMEQLLSLATSTGRGCESLICGQHASCSVTTKGAACVCNEGYIGLGTNCHAPPEFMPHRLLSETKGATITRAGDVDVCVFEKNLIAVVYRDLTRDNMGRVVVGKVRDGGMTTLSPPEPFTESGGRAFSPVIMGTEDRRLAVAWRDDSRLGSCYVRGAAMGTSGVRGADMALTWGEPVNFCTNQAHGMSMVSFPNNRIMVLFSDKVKAAVNKPIESFGNSFLAEIGNRGSISELGKFRFTDAPVCRLDVVKITPTGFILAARAGQAPIDFASTSVKQEAMAMYGELLDNELVFDPNPVNLEPAATNIWARGVSLIGPNTVAYAYQNGANESINVAVIAIDPRTHHMEVVQEPKAVFAGFSPYVSMLSLPYTPMDPHTLVYYQRGNASVVNVCSWVPGDKRLERCEEFTWLFEALTSVSGVHLGGGKSFMVFADPSGIPYYGVFGLSKK